MGVFSGVSSGLNPPQMKLLLLWKPKNIPKINGTPKLETPKSKPPKFVSDYITYIIDLLNGFRPCLFFS